MGHIDLPGTGKRICYGTVAVTTTNAVDLVLLLDAVDAAVVSYASAPAATNENLSVAWATTVMTISCWETDFTVGTTAENINYIAIGDAAAGS